MEGNKLRVHTKASKAQEQKTDDDEEFEPMSPLAEVLLTESVTLFILCFFEFEIPLNVSCIYDFFNNIFINVHPRLTSIPVDDRRGKKKWKRVQVNIEEHIKIPEFDQGLSTEEYSEHLDEYMSLLATSEIAQNKPLWEAHLFNHPTKNNAASSVIVKFHHAIADGVSLMSMLFSCFQRVDHPSIPLSYPTSNKNHNIVSTSDDKQKNHHVLKTMMKVLKILPDFVACFFNSFHEFGQSLRSIYTEDDLSPIRSGNTKLGHPHYKICNVTLSLNDVKRIKTILGVTVNDVVIGILMLGVRLYMQEMDHGEVKKTQSKLFIAVNARKAKGYALPDEMRKQNAKVPWGNKVSIIQIPITNLDDNTLGNPLSFVMEAHHVIKRKRNALFVQILLNCYIGAVQACRGLQAVADIFERRLKNPSLLYSSLVGPVEKMSVANHPVKDFYFIPTGAKASLIVSVMSYLQMLTIGLAVEKGFMDDQRLSKCIEKAFEMVFQAATATANSVGQ